MVTLLKIINSKIKLHYTQKHFHILSLKQSYKHISNSY